MFPLTDDSVAVAWAEQGFPGARPGGSLLGVNLESLAGSPLAQPGPKVFSPGEYEWAEADNGFRNRHVECYMLAALQVLGGVRALREHVASLDMSPMHPRVRFFEALKNDFARSAGGGALNSNAAAMCEHAGRGVLERARQD